MRLRYITIVEGSSEHSPLTPREIISMCLVDKPYEHISGPIRTVLSDIIRRGDKLTYRVRVQNHPLIFVAALFDSRIIGSAAIFHKGEDSIGVCRINSNEDYLAVYVKPKYRLRGVGRKLVRRALTYAKKKSAVDLLGGDAASSGFYKKLKLTYRKESNQ